MKRIFLVGYMGVGKTTLGKALARRLSLSFIDLDLFIQARYQKTVKQMFADFGEDGFRDIERKVLSEVSDFENVVISTGGGTPCFFDNMDLMNKKGKTVYLEASTEVLFKRLHPRKDKRPLLYGKSDEELLSFIKENLEKRTPFYRKAKYIFNPQGEIGRNDINKQIELLLFQLNININEKD
ncbi:shikimate kinase [Dysgonomonas sp. PH5-45]|uniref:shikimate kinase n=1 Tax=unclassified Dysgonomonas TaxID=2630389 RepID=UPI002473780B|nr:MULTISPECIES: shikimate kinase [unclassified Dysgonomonas]MDH6355303.1 shikimate kinase [Dysgonomonas sp. PH5-45]MDH6388171.1 shikimate kinase [Dysgonomonas sp. PH5-37]